jgi:hypothetical protein
MKSLQESLFTDNVKSKIVPEKLAYVIKKFFGDGVALCRDYQGSSREWYEINPSTVTVKDGRNLYARIINYCKKVDGLDVEQDMLPGFGTVKGYRIGDDKYWMYLNTVKYGEKRVHVSKEFYESGALPQDQKGVTQRGWDEWKRW